jgi:hypothetical protein
MRQPRRLTAAADQEQGFPTMGCSVGTAAGKGRAGSHIAAIRGARDAQLAIPAEPTRSYRLRGQQIDGTHRLGTQIELIRHGAPYSGLRPNAR